MKYLRYINAFKRKFDIEEPILIYGTGKIASELLSVVDGYNIIGVLDNEKISGFFMGVKIFDIEELHLLGSVSVVIVAAEKNIKIIYERIHEKCKVNNIAIYDIFGRNLDIIYSDSSDDNPYFSTTWKDLEALADVCDVISFDVFDTLVMRRTLYPEDIFEIIQGRIIDANTEESEHICRIWGCEAGGFVNRRLGVLNTPGLDCPNIYEIYENMDDTGLLTKADMEWIINLEIQTELDYIVPRKSMRGLFNRYVHNKRIILVSNMHLPENVLGRILKENGYEGYEKLFVSCDYKCSKGNGLYEKAIEETGGDAVDILHIGDNYNLDVIAANEHGIHNAFYIMNGLDMLRWSKYTEAEKQKMNILERISLGTFINDAFDDPFVLAMSHGKLAVGDFSRFGSLYAAPIVWGYSLWCYKQIKNEKTDKCCILFSARDGYVVQRIYNLLDEYLCQNKDCRGVYLYTSRMAILKAVIADRRDLEEVLSMPYDGTIGQLLENRFCIAIKDDIANDEYSEKACVRLVEKYCDDIVGECTEYKGNYMKYINKLGLSFYDKLFIIDQCGYGRVQYGMEKLTGNDIVGLYLKKNTNGVLSPKCYYSYFPDDDRCENDSLIENIILLEEIFSSYEPSVKSFDTDGNIVFQEEPRSKGQIEELRNVHNVVVEKYSPILEHDPWIFMENDITWQFADFIWSMGSEPYSDLKIPQVNVEDVFGTVNKVVKCNG
jgi:hypothetical protein